MDSTQFKGRTKAYGLRVIRLVESLPSGQTSAVIGRQLIRCGTSVGANYRAASRARSKPDFIAKMGIIEEECDESLYWMEMLAEAGLVDLARMAELMGEGAEILSMVVASIRTARANR
jgi:four helix bundle protein